MESNQDNTKVISISDDVDYYSIKAVSSSSFNRLNPEEGGSPKKFAEFILGEEEKIDSVHMQRGRLIHSFIENEKDFIVLEIDKPNDKLGDVADECIRRLHEVIISKEETYSLNDVLLASCRVIGWNPKWGDEAILKNASVIIPYVEQMLLVESQGKITMTKETKDIVNNCIASIKSHSVANDLLFPINIDENIQIFKEKDILWTEEVNGYDIPCKAKIDLFQLNHKTKTITIVDLKTGGFNLGTYKSTFKYRRTYRQLAFYMNAITEFCSQSNIHILGWTIEMYVIAVETGDEFRTGVFKIPISWYYKGKNEYEDLLDRYSYHLKNGFTYSREEYENNGILTLNDPED